MIKERIIDLGGTEDVTQIPGISEQQFFIFLNKKLPNSKIIYQPFQFQIQDEDGRIRGTIPDFLIIKPDGTKIFVEITSAQLNGSDPKEKQKRVMRMVAPGEKYRVLYRHNLENIQRLHPEISLFSARKIRKDESSLAEM